jgi:hypothetical protein
MTFNTAKITVIATTRNCGDGSACIEWFLSKDILDKMETYYCEDYAMGEGGTEYHFPNDFDFAACGMYFSDQDCLDQLREDAHVV